MPLGLPAASSSTDEAIQKKMYGLSMTTLVFSSEDWNDILKIVKYPEECGLLIKWVSETVENEVKEQKVGFLSMLTHFMPLISFDTSWRGYQKRLVALNGLTATLVASLLERVLTGKGVVTGGDGVIQAGVVVIWDNEGQEF